MNGWVKASHRIITTLKAPVDFRHRYILTSSAALYINCENRKVTQAFYHSVIAPLVFSLFVSPRQCLPLFNFPLELLNLIFSRLHPFSPACVRTALWCAPSSPARCTSPGARGAPARPPAAEASGLDSASARTQRTGPPALTLSRQRAAICRRVQVWCGTTTHEILKGT